MLRKSFFLSAAIVALATFSTGVASADPCGMVPPVYLGDGPAITRTGLQQTYVFYKDGVETFVIRPGFKGKVDEFGMLIPFPTPPAIRKVPDHIFSHVAAAVDPPEVVIDLRARYLLQSAKGRSRSTRQSVKSKTSGLKYDQVRVLKQEAVGMYEVAVLEAGSPAALKKWMDQHNFRYPDGMDKACADYVKDKWCFVAVKTKVGQKKGANPQPGQRRVNVKLPTGSTFDGSVQAMGFRFKTDELVVPMRLSTFNKGELRNVVYLLTEGPRRIRAIPEEYVMRQITGTKLLGNVTELLPLRIIGGTAAQIPEWRRKSLPQRRNPTPHNGAAKDLFAADLMAIRSGKLSLPHEEQEKELLRIGERFGLRGKEIDKQNTAALAKQRSKAVDAALADVKKMTLTVVDGDFPREVLAGANLTFAEYKMPAKRNKAELYDAKRNGPAGKKQGVIKLGAIDFDRLDRQSNGSAIELATSPRFWVPLAVVFCIAGVFLLRHRRTAALVLVVATLATSSAMADPCGMVPPIYLGDGPPITRVGNQQTYVFFKDGVETFVIRPGYKGKVDQFGMLIPFPSVPAIRKVPDAIFSHLAAAVDPPEVVIDLRQRFLPRSRAASAPARATADDGLNFSVPANRVRVLKREAVGMYEVVVLAAGSSKALKRWMDEHGYKYPDGMDKACDDYVKDKWCFVAVKTKVGQKAGVDPRPGQRKVKSKLPSGSTFDGSVQAMGFRFKVDELVVPMRLSSFNPGELRNIVYLLTDGPRKVRAIPEEYVVRQLTGKQLFDNVTGLLPLRIIGGTAADIPAWQRKTLPARRNPAPKNGAAKDLFASDLRAVVGGKLSLPHEEKEKELLRIGERFGLRGKDIDVLNEKSLADQRAKIAEKALAGLKQMTLTVVDGDFPRELLAKQNLTFAEYKMPARRNKAEVYDAKKNGPGGKKQGVLKVGAIDFDQLDKLREAEQRTETSVAASSKVWGPLAMMLALAGVLVLRRRRAAAISLVVAALVTGTAMADPCGMVPPVYLGEGAAITRIGLQQTYVCYKDGIETFVIRPGFKGKVDQFGMLIPFPTPPAIRKVPDHIFPQIAAAVDPPEVVVDLRIRPVVANSALFGGDLRLKDSLKSSSGKLGFNQVRVLKQEAVGMYEVAVLEAGSPAALKKWMDDHKFRYPQGMDKACADYVKDGWCFVAVKTKVGQKKGADPKPGQRRVNVKLPTGSTFDGSVQAMGFRFKTDKLVVPMRLSSFNPGELRNVVYLLTDGPRKIRAIPEEYVMRQISGEKLFANVTGPLPLRIIGGTAANIPAWQQKTLPQRRNPTPKNGAAKDLFASDLKAITSGNLSLPHEEQEKELLRIGERFGLRGKQIDKLNTTALAEVRSKAVDAALVEVKKMTLTVIDGDFPREVLAGANLTFAEYKMPAKLNRPEKYDAVKKGPAGKKQGVLKLGAIDFDRLDRQAEKAQETQLATAPMWWIPLAALFSLAGIFLLRHRRTAALVLLVATLAASTAMADPCGMVPPVYLGDGPPITRVGHQQTYVFFKDGVETFVIRPGFKGNVDEFGMLIPFPSVPAIRKVPDHIFPHLAAAVDPPEVVVDVRRYLYAKKSRGKRQAAGEAFGQSDKLQFKDQVRVLKQEAVGMYEVAVLAAGSSKALKRWMDEHGYKYPDGMDKACDDYVEDGWCFVAVKTKVGQKGGVDPKPGQRTVRSKLPAGSTFDGSVQAMGFRFKVDKLVVPMRLSSFNKGELRNIVYLLTDGPRRVRAIPEEYVVRQITGPKLFGHLTDPLPLRIIGGTMADVPEWQRKTLPARRNPVPKNGAARDLFASDLLAIGSKSLSLPHEEQEKELLRIGERLGLRGKEIDQHNAQALKKKRDKTVAAALAGVKNMTLTVVDGDFPRQVLAKQNLTFAEYTMPNKRNNSQHYDAKTKRPGGKKQGVLKLGAVDWRRVDQIAQAQQICQSGMPWLLSITGLSLLGLALAGRMRGRAAMIMLLVAATIGMFAQTSLAVEEPVAAKAPAKKPTIRQLLNQLSKAETAGAAVTALVKRAPESKAQLKGEALEGGNLTRRGWAIVALSEIGGQDVDELLLKVHSDTKQPMLVRTWAAAGRVAMVESTEALIEKATLVASFPALGRPVGMRLVEKLNDGGEVSAEGLLSVTLRVPQLRQGLAPAILASGEKKLTAAMATAKDQNVRRQAAAYLGTLAGQGNKKVGSAVASAYKFDAEAKNVPWRGGPLFVPGIGWAKEDARSLVGSLIAWHLWCDQKGRKAEQKQIHNNIRSLGLARVAGYQSPGFREVGTVRWLQIWKKTAGKEAVAAMLKAQGADKVAKYAAVLN